MGSAKVKAKLLPFDAARYHIDDGAIAKYMTAVLDTEDTELFLLALSDVARAKGMAQVAKDAGLVSVTPLTSLTFRPLAQSSTVRSLPPA